MPLSSLDFIQIGLFDQTRTAPDQTCAGWHLHHLQRLAQAGVGYRSFTERYLDSCGIFKDAVLSILATIAEQERIRISERVHAGLAQARKQGRIGGRPGLVLSQARIT